MKRGLIVRGVMIRGNYYRMRGNSHAIAYANSTMSVYDCERVHVTMVANLNVSPVSQDHREVVNDAISPDGN
jgi:hypothetical protein